MSTPLSMTMLGMKLRILHRNICAKLILPSVGFHLFSVYHFFFPQPLEENICRSTLTPFLPSPPTVPASADKFCSTLKISNSWRVFFFWLQNKKRILLPFKKDVKLLLYHPWARLMLSRKMAPLCSAQLAPPQDHPFSLLSGEAASCIDLALAYYSAEREEEQENISKKSSVCECSLEGLSAKHEVLPTNFLAFLLAYAE